MTEQPEEWTTWIITTLLTGLTTVVGTVVFLTKFIGNRYAQELTDQKAAFAEYRIEIKKELEELKNAIKDCQEDRFKLAMQIHELQRTADNKP